jgi:uncharacterized membrane protein YesL
MITPHRTSRLQKIVSFVALLFITNLLMLLANLQLAFSLLFVPYTPNNILLFILLGITLGPSITAVLTLFWRFLTHQEFQYWRTFWACYRQNFKQAGQIALITNAIMFVALFDFWYFLPQHQFSFIAWLMLLIALLTPVVAFYAYLFIARFQIRTRDALANGVTALIRYFGPTINLIVAGYGILFIFCHFLPTILFLFSLPLFLGVLSMTRQLHALTSQQNVHS